MVTLYEITEQPDGGLWKGRNMLLLKQAM